MGVPENYPLRRNYNEAYHLFGDGLVVPVVSWLERHKWLDVQHRCMAIAQRALQQPALHAVAAMAAAAVTVATRRTRTRLTPRR